MPNQTSRDLFNLGCRIRRGEVKPNALDHTSYMSARLHGINLNGLSLTGIHFKNCKFSYVDFAGCELTDIEFINCVFYETDFINTSLNSCKFSKPTFDGCLFYKVRSNKLTVFTNTFSDLSIVTDCEGFNLSDLDNC